MLGSEDETLEKRGSTPNVREVYKIFGVYDIIIRAETTNNGAERTLREYVVQRRIMGCFRNGKGTGIYETEMTVLTT